MEKIKDIVFDELQNIDGEDAPYENVEHLKPQGDTTPSEKLETEDSQPQVEASKSTEEVKDTENKDIVQDEVIEEKNSSIDDWFKSKIMSDFNERFFEIKKPIDIFDIFNKDEDEPYENVAHLKPQGDTTPAEKTDDVELTEQYEYMASEAVDTVLDKTGILDFVSVSDGTSDFIKDLTLQALKENMTQEEIDEMNAKYGDPLTEEDKAEFAKTWESLEENPEFSNIMNSIPKWDEE